VTKTIWVIEAKGLYPKKGWHIWLTYKTRRARDKQYKLLLGCPAYEGMQFRRSKLVWVAFA
jgi:hypothetical protein